MGVLTCGVWITFCGDVPGNKEAGTWVLTCGVWITFCGNVPGKGAGTWVLTCGVWITFCGDVPGKGAGTGDCRMFDAYCPPYIYG